MLPLDRRIYELNIKKGGDYIEYAMFAHMKEINNNLSLKLILQPQKS